MVEAEIDRQHITKAILAHRLNVAPGTIQGMYERKRIPIHQLMKFSKVLNYNFFRVIADKLDIQNPQPENTDDNQEQNELTIMKLQTKIDVLEELYIKAFSSLGDKGKE